MVADCGSPGLPMLVVLVWHVSRHAVLANSSSTSLPAPAAAQTPFRSTRYELEKEAPPRPSKHMGASGFNPAPPLLTPQVLAVSDASPRGQSCTPQPFLPPRL